MSMLEHNGHTCPHTPSHKIRSLVNKLPSRNQPLRVSTNFDMFDELSYYCWPFNRGQCKRMDAGPNRRKDQLWEREREGETRKRWMSGRCVFVSLHLLFEVTIMKGNRFLFVCSIRVKNNNLDLLDRYIPHHLKWTEGKNFVRWRTQWYELKLLIHLKDRSENWSHSVSFSLSLLPLISFDKFFHQTSASSQTLNLK